MQKKKNENVYLSKNLFYSKAIKKKFAQLIIIPTYMLTDSYVSMNLEVKIAVV